MRTRGTISACAEVRTRARARGHEHAHAKGHAHADVDVVALTHERGYTHTCNYAHTRLLREDVITSFGNGSWLDPTFISGFF